jgi:hypothetical protein
MDELFSQKIEPAYLDKKYINHNKKKKAKAIKSTEGNIRNTMIHLAPDFAEAKHIQQYKFLDKVDPFSLEFTGSFITNALLNVENNTSSQTSINS